MENFGALGGFRLKPPSMLKCGSLISGSSQSKSKNFLIFSMALPMNSYTALNFSSTLS